MINSLSVASTFTYTNDLFARAQSNASKAKLHVFFVELFRVWCFVEVQVTQKVLVMPSPESTILIPIGTIFEASHYIGVEARMVVTS